MHATTITNAPPNSQRFIVFAQSQLSADGTILRNQQICFCIGFFCSGTQALRRIRRLERQQLQLVSWNGGLITQT